MHAQRLFADMAGAFIREPARWASTTGAPSAVVRVALPYSLKQLSDWLACGGLALGAPAPVAPLAIGVLHKCPGLGFSQQAGGLQVSTCITAAAQLRWRTVSPCPQAGAIKGSVSV